MLKAILLGYGAMGRTIEQVVQDHSSLEIVGKCDRYATDCYPTLADIAVDFDVIIDFSKPESLTDTVAYCAARQKPIVIATTGFTPEQVAQVQVLSKQVAVFYTQNMSLGINVVEKALKLIAPMLKDNFDIEIVESHHNKKVDAPSGTAKMLLRAVEGEHTHKQVYGREGYAPRDKGEIGIHAIRGGTIAGEHTVIFAGNDEIIEIKHTALSKKVFAEGAIKAAQFIATAPIGLYQMGDIL